MPSPLSILLINSIRIFRLVRNGIKNKVDLDDLLSILNFMHW